jgi:hypothetical protein
MSGNTGRASVADLGVGVRLSDDRNVAEIEIVVDDRPLEPVLMDLDQITKFVALLGEVRTRMLEGRPRMDLKGHEVRTVNDPTWMIQVAQIDGSLLAFDHPGFGPVAFAIPRSDVAEMVRLLKAHLALPSPLSKRRN